MSSAASGQEKYSVGDVHQKFELFFIEYTCRDVHRLVTILQTPIKRDDNKLLMLGFLTYLRGYAAGKNLSMKEAAAEHIQGCKDRMDEPFIGHMPGIDE